MSVEESVRLRPITRAEARMYIAKTHRHNKPPSVSVFHVALEDAGDLVGVASCARPGARKLCDGYTLEVSRVATDGTRNANSMLYGACSRAAKSLGYRRLVTYTLVSESGSSLKGAGWTLDPKTLRSRPEAWETQRTPRSQSRDLFGNPTMPNEDKRRWWKNL